MQNTHVPNSNDFTFSPDAEFIRDKGIVLLSITYKKFSRIPVRYNGLFLYLLVKAGTGKIVIAGKKHTLESMTLVVLAPEYISQLVDISPDFRCNLLLITKSFLDSLPASDKMYRHIAKMMLQQQQVNKLNKQQYLVLSESIHTIQKKMNLPHHHLKQEIIQTVFMTFLLEISNIWIENHWDLLDEPHQIRYEYILKNFFDLLMQHYRQEHLVSFYAQQLNITPQYLSLIIKRLTGRTPYQFIFERLFCESRALLEHPDLSIKEIAEQLHFSDQSAFGKFFKHRSGISPVDFRKKRKL